MMKRRRVEQPSKYELVVNLRSAKALGLTIPPSLLLRGNSAGHCSSPPSDSPS